MRKLLLTGLGALALLAGACNKTKPTTATATPGELTALFAGYWERQAPLFPLAATSQGDNRYNNRLVNDQTRAFRDSLAGLYQGYLGRLTKFDRKQLAGNDLVSYDILQYDLQTRLDGLKLGLAMGADFPNSWMIPFNQFGGLPLALGQFGAGTGAQPFKTVQDYDRWLGRVHGFPVWADSAIANFRAGMKAGVVLPKTLVVKMIPQIRSLQTTDATKSLFYGPITLLPGTFANADKTRLTAAYQKAILGELVPSYKKLGDFLEKEYLPKARATTGHGALPNGPAQYNFLVKNWTTTSRTPAEIHDIGLREVARIQSEMNAVRTRLVFHGDLKALLAYMKTDRRFFPYKTPEDVLNGFRAIQGRMQPNLKKLFGRTPKTPFEVRQTEAFRAASASAEYNQGTPDGSRPGIFYVPILDATQYRTPGMESLFLHEAIPGHHYQVSLQQENTALPKFRRFAWYGAMGEGWALYCESLGRELGLYKDPYEYLGALSQEMHRAIRLVIDTGMHSQNLTREQAIQYSLDNEATTKEAATAEVERYMAIPGQALSYKIGQLKIRELRNRARQQLGGGEHLREHRPGQYQNKYSLAAFHDELLKDGVMPLDILDQKMTRWADAQ
ncbi:DUF885 domain-containing protein [Hymenobacter coccineus]|uniref:DUF885 domain-containing protein n=1 Tax=Hymenobacter coccineus TaxID=1908235 RepID=A0A1G1SVQ3_9BACT|nr:DUF885 domain-containing protein [Hymenobacter coccineus]OGX82687.1 hypothetical protein BEN49_13415 [Hymenobacter coccineus]